MLRLVDTNVWFALSIDLHEHHEIAQSWWKSVEGKDSICFCRATQMSFLRLLTNRAAFSQYGISPFTNQAALGIFDDTLTDDRVVLLSREPVGFVDQWRVLASKDTSSPNLWMDAYLAAFSISGGHEFVTLDADFRQFGGLDLNLLRDSP